jgi:hypothetical protein
MWLADAADLKQVFHSLARAILSAVIHNSLSGDFPYTG